MGPLPAAQAQGPDEDPVEHAERLPSAVVGAELGGAAHEPLEGEQVLVGQLEQGGQGRLHPSVGAYPHAAAVSAAST